MRSFVGLTLRATGAILAMTSLTVCSGKNYTHLYATQPFAPSYAAADVSAMKYLGATVVDKGINFSAYSENATKVQVLLFDGPDDARPSQQFDMVKQGSVWNVFVYGIGLHQIYGYRAWGPNWPYDPKWQPGTITGFQADVDSAGNRFNPNKLILDPYARMVTRPFNWALGSAASGPDRTVSTYQAAGKAITVQSTYAWSAGEAAWITGRQNPNMPGHRWQDQIVYEMHPKGFTASPASGVTHPGTFRGIGENVAYLKDLGITAVELLPSFWKSSDGGYWGYDTIGFFIPELTYVALLDPNNPESPIDEFKWMVDQLHQNGIEVYLDVVFNHTGEGGLWRDEIQKTDSPPLPDGDPALLAFDPKEVASILQWRGLDNQAFYALSQDNQTYWDNSGVGQDMRANHAPFQRQILDTLHYWVTEMHVDGFRFDEAAVLGEDDKNYNTFDPAKSVLQLIADDPVLQEQNIRLTAEPWSGGGDFNGSYPASTSLLGYGWGEWNGPFRDWWRSFLNCDGSTGPWVQPSFPDGGPPGSVGSCPNDGNGNGVQWTFNSSIYCPVSNVANGGFLIYGSEPMFQPNGRLPYHSYNFVTIHDGFTLYDEFAFNEKSNGCGPLNPACCTMAATSFCNQVDGTTNNYSRDWGTGAEPTKRALMRAAFVAMLTSHGTPLMLGGDEWMRTQLGNNNAYSSLADNANNWFDWGSWQPNTAKNRMHDFVRQMIALRKQFSYALAPGDWTTGAPLVWEDTAPGSTANWNSRHLTVHYPPSSQGPEFEILFNFESGPTNFTLPSGTWVRLVDTQAYFDQDTTTDMTSGNISLATPLAVPGSSYNVMPQSVVILENTATVASH